MIKVYNSTDKGLTWTQKVVLEGFFGKRVLERLWAGETVDEGAFGLFTLSPEDGKIVANDTPFDRGQDAKED